MTSPGATSRHAGSRPGAGPPTARTISRLDGALDVAAATALRERLIGLVHPGTGLLVRVLIGAQRRARVLGIVMRLAAPSVPVAELLRLTGLDRSLTICPDLRGALAAERHEPANPSPQVQTAH